MSSSSKKAMLGMGIDSATADRLIENGLNAKSLKALPETALRDLGLIQFQIENVIGSGRPPIPVDVLNTVLFNSKWTCCICRDPKKAVIVHHLSPWAKSRSHAVDNLAILCPEHHCEAHTTHQLTLNLTPDRIKDARDRWYAVAAAFNHNEAERLANLIAGDHQMFSVHRGVKAWGGDIAIIYGNDGPSQPRTLLEIQNVKQALQAESIDELGFATSDHEQTWVLLAASNDYRLLKEITWNAFLDTFIQAQQKSSHSVQPWLHCVISLTSPRPYKSDLMPPKMGQRLIVGEAVWKRSYMVDAKLVRAALGGFGLSRSQCEQGYLGE